MVYDDHRILSPEKAGQIDGMTISDPGRDSHRRVGSGLRAHWIAVVDVKDHCALQQTGSQINNVGAFSNATGRQGKNKLPQAVSGCGLQNVPID